MTIKAVRNQISAGKHAQWNAAVDIFGLSKTPQMSLTVREAFLVVAFRDGKNGWCLISGPTVTKDNALKTIVESHREAPASSLDTVRVNMDGTVDYSAIPADPSEECEIASLPLALGFVGPTKNGWADEVAFIRENVSILADLVGRSEDEELALLEEFAFDAANSRIEKLCAN
jgi:hypothetical protein